MLRWTFSFFFNLCSLGAKKNLTRPQIKLKEQTVRDSAWGEQDAFHYNQIDVELLSGQVWSIHSYVRSFTHTHKHTDIMERVGQGQLSALYWCLSRMPAFLSWNIHLHFGRNYPFDKLSGQKKSTIPVWCFGWNGTATKERVVGGKMCAACPGLNDNVCFLKLNYSLSLSSQWNFFSLT